MQRASLGLKHISYRMIVFSNVGEPLQALCNTSIYFILLLIYIYEVCSHIYLLLGQYQSSSLVIPAKKSLRLLFENSATKNQTSILTFLGVCTYTALSYNMFGYFSRWRPYRAMNCREVEHSKTAMILVYGVSMIKDLKHERH